jgi:hypothetical protein
MYDAASELQSAFAFLDDEIWKKETQISKIFGFHGSDYVEWRLLGYKTPVHTSQETHYVSATESSQLMLCKV